MINTVIVEDNQFMQNHLVNMLSADSDFNIAGVFKDAFDAEKACDTQQIDLVLMDVQTLHNHSGLAAGERIRKNNGAKVVIVTSLIDSEVLEKAKWKLSCIRRALIKIPEEYRQTTLDCISYNVPYGDMAHENTWRKWRQVFVWELAKNLFLI